VGGFGLELLVGQSGLACALELLEVAHLLLGIGQSIIERAVIELRDHSLERVDEFRGAVLVVGLGFIIALGEVNQLADTARGNFALIPFRQR